MKSRLLTLMLALVMGGSAVLLVSSYVSGVEKKSLEGERTRSVLVASRSLPAAMSGREIIDAEAFEVQTVPQRYALPGAFSSPDDFAGLTLADDIASGEQLTSQRFKTSPQDAFLSEFPEGTEALSLPLEYVRGVAGHIVAGDRLNAYVTAEAKKAAGKMIKKSRIPSSARVFNAGEGGVTMLLLENLPVQEVKTPAEGSSSAGGATATGSIVLAVTSEEAALLIHAQEKAKLWFTLVPQGGETA
ncbi:MAG: Flp pilus assembly protein CpaB [Actinomycetota bacterium]|nr:Flp pilus assembly protein CpaB [Actinomycetota bacterium]